MMSSTAGLLDTLRWECRVCPGMINRARENKPRNGPAFRHAAQFYWAWLVLATAVSTLGNIAHAILVAPDDLKFLAALALVVPPTFVLGSTHSVAVGLTLRRLTLAHTLGLIMTIAVAACAFLLSFDALGSLAVMLGCQHASPGCFRVPSTYQLHRATFGLLSMSAAPTQAQPFESRTMDDRSVNTSLDLSRAYAPPHHRANPATMRKRRPSSQLTTTTLRSPDADRRGLIS